MSLGSLSGASCDLLCSEAAKEGHSEKDCNDFLQQQRQVCMFLSQDQTLRINQALQLLGIRGITVLGSSGDGGSHFSFAPFEGGAIAHTLNEISCKFQIPVFPTSSPYVLSVGGEAWEGLDYKKPIAWSGSGGGFSWQFERLSHQKNIIANYLNSTEGVPESSSFNSSGRAYPDVAAVSVDGTSQSCPTVAGILSLVIDYRKSQGLSGLGFIAPRLYQVATKYPGEAFEDITKGNTKTSCDNGFPAAKGWDPVTGWGRPQWAGLLKHFGSDDFL
jgi:tripeptidyl-peptidase-1